MKTFRFLSAFSSAVAFLAGAIASAHAAYDTCASAAREVVGFLVDVFETAFPLRDRPAISEVGLPAVRTLGRVQARSYRSRVLARQSDDRSRAPLAAAFVTA